MLQTTAERGKLMTVRDGYLACHICRRNKRLMKIDPDTEGHGIVAFCRVCKTEHKIDIVQGQCYESQSQ